jgi:hypothetical protein
VNKKKEEKKSFCNPSSTEKVKEKQKAKVHKLYIFDFISFSIPLQYGEDCILMQKARAEIPMRSTAASNKTIIIITTHCVSVCIEWENVPREAAIRGSYEAKRTEMII